MEYIIIEYCPSKVFEIYTDMSGFIQYFYSYEEAFEYAKENDLEDFGIFVKCSESKNYLV
jgi:hypothetical protein